MDTTAPLPPAPLPPLHLGSASPDALGPGARRVLVGAMLAAPICLVVMRLFFVTQRSFWQELAWLMSAVFWCALGALCYLFVRSLLHNRRHHK